MTSAPGPGPGDANAAGARSPAAPQAGLREPRTPNPAAATHRLPVEQQLQRGKSVRGRLPRARAGPRQQVLPLQGQRDGLLLDQRGSRPAQVGDGLGDTTRGSAHRPSAAPSPAGPAAQPSPVPAGAGGRGPCARSPKPPGPPCRGWAGTARTRARQEGRDGTWGATTNQLRGHRPLPEVLEPGLPADGGAVRLRRCASPGSPGRRGRRRLPGPLGLKSCSRLSLASRRFPQRLLR